MIPKWRQHCDKSIGSIRQGEGAEFVKNILSVGDGWKQPVGILLIDALREERDDSEKLPGIRAEFSKHWGGEGKFGRGREASRVRCVKNSRSVFLPLLSDSSDHRQSIVNAVARVGDSANSDSHL